MKVLIDQRLVIESESYSHIGAVMDKLAEETEAIMHKAGVKGHADFVNFQTRPCKAMAMDQLAYDGPDVAPQQIEGGRF
jgi:hypothetical protein